MAESYYQPIAFFVQHTNIKGHVSSTPSNAKLVFKSDLKKFNTRISGNLTACIAKSRHAFSIYAVYLPDIPISLIKTIIAGVDKSRPSVYNMERRA